MSAPVVKFTGTPDGPSLFVKELDQEVGTFLAKPGGRFPALNYHVPLNKRGPYRLTDLPYKSEFRVDLLGYVLCQANTAAGELCLKRAQNRSFRCDQHGGRIHPLDKIVKEDIQEATNQNEAQALSRYKQYLAGQITIDDLDDEELACCGFRAKNGRIYKPRNVPRTLAEGFTKAIYERAQRELQSHTVEAAQTVAQIMLNPKIEPDIRLKAANTLLDRGLGKAPQQINISAELTGFDQVFEGIFSGKREESRGGRDFLDVEVEEEPNHIDSTEMPESGLLAIGAEPVVPVDDPASRLSVRNPAIMAQTVEIKPFVPDLTDRSEEIKKETRKRYAQRGIENEPPIAYIREELPNGMYRHVLPKKVKSAAPESKSKVEKRKRFTLSDFT